MAKKIKHEGVLLFNKNYLGYSLTLISIGFEFLFSIKILDSINVGMMMGFSCFLNIVLLFLLFTIAVRVNVYDVDWAKISLIIAIYAIIRCFIIVPFMLKPYQNVRFLSVTTLIEGLFLVFSGIESLSLSHRRIAFLKTDEGRALMNGELL